MSSRVHQYARASLASVVVTAALTTVLHLYELGPVALVMGLILTLGPFRGHAFRISK